MLKDNLGIYFETYFKGTDKTLWKTIDSQLDIQLERFTEENLNVVLTKIKSRKATGHNELLPPLEV